MLLTVFEKYIFLQSIGWGIANSLWQVAFLWLIYRSVTISVKDLSALFKYHFSLVLQLASFGWFVSTIIQNYFAAIETGSETVALNWLNVSPVFSSSLQWLSVAYFIALTVHLLLFAKKLNRLFLFQKNDLAKAPVDIRLFTEQTAFHIGIKRKVTVWLSPKAGVPSVIGFFKPMVLLPVSALNNLTTAQAEAVLLHELAHIKRNDYIVNILQCIIEAILFFNPFVKMLGNTARAERENCCDDWVLNFNYNKHDYASALLVLEQNRVASIQFALAATNGKKNLLNRIKRLFAEEPVVQFTIFQRMRLITVSLFVLLLTFFVMPLTETKEVVITSTENNIAATALFASATNTTPVSYSENKKLSLIISDDNAPSIKTKKSKRQTVKKQPVIELDKPKEVEINTALINEELLNQDFANQAIQVANVEPTTTGKILVQVEEEQSGDKAKRIYLVQVDTTYGSQEVKPLILLDKKVKAIVPDTKEKRSSTIKVAAKKRITS